MFATAASARWLIYAALVSLRKSKSCLDDACSIIDGMPALTALTSRQDVDRRGGGLR